MEERISLNGIWDFAYQPDGPLDQEHIPAKSEFQATMKVPGYWDDDLTALKKTEVWSNDMRFNPAYRRIEYPLGTGRPFDTSLPYIIGNGWYRKVLRAGTSLEDRVILLEISGAMTDLAVFVNGTRLLLHQNQMSGICLPIQDYLRPGQDNELLLAVSNLRRDVISCSSRGYKGFAAGIYGDVVFHTAKYCAVRELYAYPDETMTRLRLTAQLEYAAKHPSLDFEWSLYAKDTSERVCHSFSKEPELLWDCSGLRRWSDQDPYLYTLELTVYADGVLCDRFSQPFGLRRMSVRPQEILLNQSPVYLRGFTEHAYYPLTCTPPLDPAYYREAVAKYRSIGFNWIRFHTTVPNELYLDACDELGMLVQVEAPNRFTDLMWRQILLKCRKHPCVILYCGGNEVCLTDPMVSQLEGCAALQKELVPDALFSPMQGLAYADWFIWDWEKNEPNAPVSTDPFPHNPVKMAWLRSFTDVFQPQKHIGIDEIETTWQDLERKIAMYQRPYTSHELGIYDSYINLDLEKRYEGTRIGTDLYAGARRQLQDAGLLSNAPVYYRNSCYWSVALRKLEVERLRMCDGVCGYDYLGAIDYHWHRCGYTPGILNEFFEHKPGEGPRDILRYNGENLVLADLLAHRNYWCEDVIRCNAFASIYGATPAGSARLSWRLVGPDGQCYAQHSRQYDNIETHRKFALGEISVTTPRLDSPEHCRLCLTLECDHYYLENEYDVWIFPHIEADPSSVYIATEDGPEVYEHLENGDRVLILSPLQMKNMPLSYNKSLAGRPIGTTATVLHDHPLWKSFPNDGWCDFQFYPMMTNSCSIVWDDCADLPFDPILETVNAYKVIFKQTAMFEFCVDHCGQAVVCTLNLSGSDPAQVTLLSQILRYMRSADFAPKHTLTMEQAQQLFHNGGQLALDYSRDTGLDRNAVLLN